MNERVPTNTTRRTFLKAGAATAVAGALAAPSIARAQKTFQWRMTTAFPARLPSFSSGPGSAEDLAKNIEQMSSGRLKIKVFTGGELIPAFGGFDAVQQGNVEMNNGVAYYWSGQFPGYEFFATVPFGLNFQGQCAWYYHGGGIELWNELARANNAVVMPCGNTGIQWPGFFKRPVKSLADLNGLKMRIPGIAGKVYAGLGVKVVLLPAGELFPALERGAIDACEWVGPLQDRHLGLHKAAKYYVTTPWHEPSTTRELRINKKAWDSLPKDLQAIVQIAARAAVLNSFTYSEAGNAEALDDMVKNYGTITMPFPNEVTEALRKGTTEVLADLAAKDPLTKKIFNSFMAFKKTHDRWNDLSEVAFAAEVRKSPACKI